MDLKWRELRDRTPPHGTLRFPFPRAFDPVLPRSLRPRPNARPARVCGATAASATPAGVTRTPRVKDQLGEPLVNPATPWSVSAMLPYRGTITPPPIERDGSNPAAGVAVSPEYWTLSRAMPTAYHAPAETLVGDDAATSTPTP